MLRISVRMAYLNKSNVIDCYYSNKDNRNNNNNKNKNNNNSKINNNNNKNIKLIIIMLVFSLLSLFYT